MTRKEVVCVCARAQRNSGDLGSPSLLLGFRTPSSIAVSSHLSSLLQPCPLQDTAGQSGLSKV